MDVDFKITLLSVVQYMTDVTNERCGVGFWRQVSGLHGTCRHSQIVCQKIGLLYSTLVKQISQFSASKTH